MSLLSGLPFSANPNEVHASGGEIETSGDYRFHTFNQGSGSLNISYIPEGTTNLSASILVVAGGGAGGGNGLNNPWYGLGGGGGAGGGVVMVPRDSGSISKGVWQLYVGAGGQEGTEEGADAGGTGEDSYFVSASFALTAKGGGGGGTAGSDGTLNDGGSGGGGNGANVLPVGYPSASWMGNGDEIQSVQSGDSAVYGYDGGYGYGYTGGNGAGGGGGGATEAGADRTTNNSKGGNGIQWATIIGGDNITYGGGGGGGGNITPTFEGNGGAGGGGKGSYSGAAGASPSGDGVDGQGGGGGGAGKPNTRSRGGNGVIKVSYKYKNL